MKKKVRVFSLRNLARIPAFISGRMGHYKKVHLMHAAKIIITFSTQFSFGYLKLTPHMVAVRGRLKMSSFIYLFCFHILAWRKLHIEWPKKKKNGPFVRKSGLNVCWVCKFNSRQRKKTGAMLQTVQLDNWLLKDVCIHPIYFVNQSGQLLTDLAAIPKFYQPYSTSFYTTLFCSMLF